ncbi:MAG: fumarylacetoacetate hydrolase family protein [Acidimicrobiales bacterium]
MRAANLDGRAAIVLGDRVFDAEEASGGRLPADPMGLIQVWELARSIAGSFRTDGGSPLESSRLRAPVPRPGAIYGVVANYPPATLPEPAVPMVFGKFPTAVTGPYDPIRLPDPERLPMKAEWTVLEAELAVVIGAGGRHIAPAEALSKVAGFTVAQDVTERVHEFGPRGTSVGTMDYASLKSLGKSLDTFCPLGPMLVSLDELPDPNRLEIECRLNGTVVQKANTADLLIGVADLVSLLSSFCTLRPGDVILTGTPTPLEGSLPRLAAGDVIETEIAGIGLMRNECVAEDCEAP